jgi:hypothetical protein
MAIMAEVRDKAVKGDRNARRSKAQIDKYIKEHPPSQMGIDQWPPGGGLATSDVLFNKMRGANQNAMRALWSAPMDKFAEVFIKASPFVNMWQGVMCIVHRASLDEKDPLVLSTNVKQSRMGAIVRKAVRMRRLRNRGAPLSIYCRATGWEHGE